MTSSAAVDGAVGSRGPCRLRVKGCPSEYVGTVRRTSGNDLLHGTESSESGDKLPFSISTADELSGDATLQRGAQRVALPLMSEGVALYWRRKVRLK